jgi:hypothetical protein
MGQKKIENFLPSSWESLFTMKLEYQLNFLEEKRTNIQKHN